MAIMIPAFLMFSSCRSTKVMKTAPVVSGLELQERNEKTTAVFNFIRDNFGTKIISAQQESTWMGSTDYEMD